MKVKNEFSPESDFLTEALEKLKNLSENFVHKVKEDYIPIMKELVRNLLVTDEGLTFGLEVDILDKKTLVDFAKKYIVNGSNEIVAMKVIEEDAILIYLAYSYDRQLLPPSDNNYLIIKSNSLDSDVEDLFNNSDLIILK